MVSSDMLHEFEWNMNAHIENQMTIEEYTRHVRVTAVKTYHMKQPCRHNIQPSRAAMKGQKPDSGANTHAIMLSLIHI